MTNLRHVLTAAVICFMGCLSATAKTIDITFGDDKYTIDTETGKATLKEVSVSKGGADCEYKIPESIDYDNDSYVITEVGGNAFYFITHMRKVIVPKTVDRIYTYSFHTEVDSLIIEDSTESLLIDRLIYYDAGHIKPLYGTFKYLYLGRPLIHTSHLKIKVVTNQCRVEDLIYKENYLTKLETVEVGPMVSEIYLYGLQADTINILASDIPLEILGVDICNNLILNRDIKKLEFSNYQEATKRGGWSWDYGCDYYIYYYPTSKEIHCLTLGSKVTVLPDDFYSNFTDVETITLGSPSHQFDITMFNKFDVKWWRFLLDKLEFLYVPDDNDSFSSDGKILYDKNKTVAYYAVKRGQPKTIELPASVKTINDSAFFKNSCYQVIAPGVENIGSYAFESCQFSYFVTDKPIRSFGRAAFKNAGLTEITLDNVTEIPADSVFYGCRNLVLDTDRLNSLKVIGNYVFAGCSGLTAKGSVNLKNMNSIGKGAFEGTDIVSVSGIPAEIPAGCFKDCAYLNLPVDELSDVTIIGDYAFSNAGTKAEIQPAIRFNRLKSIGAGAFQNTEIKSVKGLSPRIPDYCFENCNNLILDDQWINNLETVGKYAFADCVNMTETGDIRFTRLTALAEGAFRNTPIKTLVVDYPINEIPLHAFAECQQLDSVKLHDNIAILDNAFENCENLRTLVIPRNLKELKDNIFEYVLPDNVYYLTKTPVEYSYIYTWGDAGPYPGYKSKLYIPKGSLSTFQITQPWKDFFDWEGSWWWTEDGDLKYEHYALPSDNVIEIDIDDAGVDEITFDTDIDSGHKDLPVEYYDMQGRRVNNPGPGLYIRKQGTKVDKVAL